MKFKWILYYVVKYLQVTYFLLALFLLDISYKNHGDLFNLLGL